MEKVVYVLGAGFSAPLGLPVMKDFLLKAKDMYAANTAKYKHFGEVFRQLDEMARVKNYFSANLFNIEEVLSILEMESYVEGLGTTQMFTKMIEDVVTFYTPPVNPGGTPRAPRALSVVFDEIWWRHGVFVAGLFGRQYKVWTNQDTREQTITTEPIGKSTAEYAVVTLNYDLVLEKMADVVAAHDTSGEPPRLQIHPGPATGTIGPVVCKLHGSAGSSTIIPPTWNKSLKPEIDAAWREAHRSRMSG